jgi:hypothetical protein
MISLNYLPDLEPRRIISAAPVNGTPAPTSFQNSGKAKAISLQKGVMAISPRNSGKAISQN